MKTRILAVVAALAVLLDAAPGRCQAPARRLPGDRTLAQWVNDLQDNDPAVRLTAVAALQLFGAEARKAGGPALIKQLESKDASVRANAAIALGVIGLDSPDLQAGVTALTRRLKDTQAIVRYQAVVALSRFGVDARPALPDLLPTVRDNVSWEIRKAGCLALGAAGEDQVNGPDMRAVNALLKAMAADYTSQVRLAAVQGLIVLGPPGRMATPADKTLVESQLGARLKAERNKVVQIWIRVALMRMDKRHHNEAMLTAIAKNLKGEDLYARTSAAWALGTIGPDARSRVGDLTQALGDAEPSAVVFSAWALSQMGKDAMSAVPPLTELARVHDDPVVRAAAEDAAERIRLDRKARTAPREVKPKPEDVKVLSSTTPVGGKTMDQWLHELRGTGDASVKENAMATLRLYGPVARSAVPILCSEMRSNEVSLRVNALLALRMIGVEPNSKDSPVVAKNLDTALRDPQGIVRFQAALLAARLGTAARESIPELVTVAKDPVSWELRRAALYALGSVALDDRGPEAQVVVALVGSLNDPSAQVKVEALQSLIVLGGPANGDERSALVRKLQVALPREPDQLVALWLRLALIEMDGVKPEYVNPIANQLKSPDARLRASGARALGIVGKGAKDKIPDLRTALQDSDPGVVVWSAWALGLMREAATAAVPALSALLNHKEEAVRNVAADAIDRIQGKEKKPQP